MATDTITVRVEPDIKGTVDAIAAALDRDRSYVINQALADYIETHRWHIRHIRKGLSEAEAGQFVPANKVRATIRKLRGK